MKIKLKISKQLKRELKEQATALEVERTIFVVQELKKWADQNKESWENLVETYPSFVETREADYETLKEKLVSEEADSKDTTDQLRAFRIEHKMFPYIKSKNKKNENLILNVEEELYYALQILAELNNMCVENYVEQSVHHLKQR